MSSSAEPTVATGSDAMAHEVVDAAPDDRQRRAQLVARVGGELALASQGGALVGQRSRIGTSARRA